MPITPILRLSVLFFIFSCTPVTAQINFPLDVKILNLTEFSTSESIIDLDSYLYFSESQNSQDTEPNFTNWTRWEEKIDEEIKTSVSVRFYTENSSDDEIIKILYLHDLQQVRINIFDEKNQLCDQSKGGILTNAKKQNGISGLIIHGVGLSAQNRITIPPGRAMIQLKIDFRIHKVFRPKLKLFSEKSWESEVFDQYKKENFFHWIFFGALWLMAIYHLLIFIQNRELAFFWYFAYTLCISLVLMIELGLFQVYLFPDNPKSNLLLPYLQLHSQAVFVVYFLFLRSFIDLKKLLPYWDKILIRFLVGLFVTGSLLSLIFVWNIDDNYIEMTTVSYVVPLIGLAFGVLYFFIILSAKNRLANFFLTGSIVLLTGVIANAILSVLVRFGFIDALPFPKIYILETAVIIEILIFALALGYRQRLRDEKRQRIEELDTLKTKFFANISHEFRTPLTVISGIAESLESYPQKKELILRNSTSLLSLVNQLLDLSKLDAGQLKLNPVHGDIVNFINYLTESFYSLAKEKNVRLTFYSEESNLNMDFDELKIQQIINNLLSNALKFTPEKGKVVLHLKKVTIDYQSYLQIKVQDTGTGISGEDQLRIFDRFFQTESKQFRKGEGTGIGLALTKELVELCGGKISVKSTEEIGTEFLVLLPILKKSKTQPLPKKELKKLLEEKQINPIFDNSIEQKTNNRSSETSPELIEKLLIIEDNPDIVAYLKTLLKDQYKIEVEENGRAGIERAFESVPDVILSDVMMPEADGYEVCKTLKNDERTSHIPIILLTAKATDEDRIEGLIGGADAYLTKPFNKKELFIRLEKSLELRKILQKKYSDNILNPKTSADKAKKSNPSKDSKQVAPKDIQLDLENAFLKKLIKVVEKRIDDPNLGVKDLCRTAGLSNMQVNRKLKALTGKTPSIFIRSIRLRKAKKLLKNPKLNISEIAYAVGFNDPNYFSRAFSEEYGVAPTIARK